VRYEAEGFGVGEVWLAGDVLLEHSLPRPGGGEVSGSHPLADRFRAYFAGDRVDFGDVELDLDGTTPFQRAATEALRAIGYGETVTYGELAALAGHPGAQRAAGTFCAGNRFGLVVPCHRVVAASGPGQYPTLGVGYKLRLLELEGAEL
jgi:methylated-DNA-[protein]-cysteine S-methyltransferase